MMRLFLMKTFSILSSLNTLSNNQSIITTAKHKIAVLDFGVKKNILRSLTQRDCYLKVFPLKTTLKELTDFNTWIGVLSATTLVFGAVYTLRAYQLSMFGAPKNDTFEDLRWNEIVVFFILSIAVVVFGLFPHLISDLVGPSLDRLLAIFNAPTSL